ncbi:MAG: hypothetical protein H5T97_10530 [Firmicutes bacterium]|nr:hypothetical protein [Bacillota bacterium]
MRLWLDNVDGRAVEFHVTPYADRAEKGRSRGVVLGVDEGCFYFSTVLRPDADRELAEALLEGLAQLERPGPQAETAEVV